MRATRSGGEKVEIALIDGAVPLLLHCGELDLQHGKGGGRLSEWVKDGERQEEELSGGEGVRELVSSTCTTVSSFGGTDLSTSAFMRRRKKGLAERRRGGEADGCGQQASVGK